MTPVCFVPQLTGTPAEKVEIADAVGIWCVVVTFDTLDARSARPGREKDAKRFRSVLPEWPTCRDSTQKSKKNPNSRGLTRRSNPSVPVQRRLRIDQSEAGLSKLVAEHLPRQATAAEIGSINVRFGFRSHALSILN